MPLYNKSVTEFTELTDAPSSLSGGSLKVVRVNAGETALEFATIAGTGDVVGPVSSTSGAVVLYDGITGKLIKDSTILPTTVGIALNNLANPSAVRFIRINADNSVTARTAAEFLSDIGAQAAGSYLTASNIVGTITNGVTTNAPSEDAVFDALALKANALGPDENYVTDAQLVVIGNTSGANSGDNAVNSLYSGLVSNATHTGDATGATALTVVKIQGKDFPTLGAGDDQKYPKYDHGTNAFVMSTVSGGSGLSQQQVMAIASLKI